MVILDSTALLMFFYDDVEPPNDPATQRPVERCRERVEHLINRLSDAGTTIVVPTPILAELLVTVGPDLQDIQTAIESERAFQVQPFDQQAAIEMASMFAEAADVRRQGAVDETKVKLKFDLQLLAVAVIHGVHTIYTNDRGLSAKARARGITVVPMDELPLPPEPPQGRLPLPEPGAEEDQAN